LNFLNFRLICTQKTEKSLSDFINEYIENFKNDDLQKEKENYYCFNEQKEKLCFSKLRLLAHKYGKSFIYKYPEDPFYIPLTIVVEKYLFIHTLIAWKHWVISK